MNDIIDAIKDVFLNDSAGKDKPALHIGEVMALWTYHTALDEFNRFVEVGLNTTKDKELINLLKSSFDECHKQNIELEELLREEGVPIPPTAESKPKSDPTDIPQGVKLTDSEIANGISVKNIAAINLCSVSITQTLRVDVGAMWLKFFLDKVKSTTKLRTVMGKRGWLKVPPPYNPSGIPKK